MTVPEPMNIGQKAARGFFSILTRNMIARVMGLVSMVVLARKLSPSDFGLVSITEVLLQLIAVFGVTGVFEFLVSYRGNQREAIQQAAFWFNVGMGLLVAAALCIAAPFWAESYADERIIVLAYLIAGTFLNSCLQILPKSILSQQLDFETQARIQTPFIVLIPIGKIGLAYLGFGVYSLVLPTLTFSILQTFLFYRAVHWKFQGSFGTQYWNEIFGFSKHLIGTTFLTRITDEGDKFFVGKLLGLEALGVYNLASQTAHLFPSNVTTITNQIFASTFPKFAHDRALMRVRFLKVTKVIAFFSLPLMGVMALAAEPLILWVYSEKWSAAIVPFQILTVFAIFRSITSSTGAVFNSLQVPQRAFYPLLIYAPIHLALSYWSSQQGLIFLASSVVLLRVLYLQYRVHQVAGLLHSSWIRFYTNLSSIIAATGMAFFAGYLAGLVRFEHPSFQLLSIGTAFGLAYLAFFKLSGSKDLIEMQDFFRRLNLPGVEKFRSAFLKK